MAGRAEYAPIVIFGFNRPNPIRAVLQAIPNKHQRDLRVFLDGPRQSSSSDIETTAEVLEVCMREGEAFQSMSIRRHEANLGVRANINLGLKDAFQEFESAIILEDDCLPSRSFFLFADELLEKFRFDNRVGMIQGHSRFSHRHAGLEESYYLSNRPKIWGWATWRRAHHGFDAEKNQWESISDGASLLRANGYSSTEAFFLRRIFSRLSQIDTWDYQWALHLWTQGLGALAPSVNLVRNIGFGKDAAHTRTGTYLKDQKVQHLEFPLKHPEDIYARNEIDRIEANLHRVLVAQHLVRNPKDALLALWNKFGPK